MGQNGRKCMYDKEQSENKERWMSSKTKPIPSQSLLASSTAGGRKTNLKKQTQFVKGVLKNKANLPAGQIGVNLYLKGDYGNISPCGA